MLRAPKETIVIDLLGASGVLGAPRTRSGGGTSFTAKVIHPLKLKRLHTQARLFDLFIFSLFNIHFE